MAANPELSLIATGLTKHYGGVKALSNVTFELPPGRTLGVIGPNGAGKSTLLSLISGGAKPTSGTISWCGRQIDRLPNYAIARLGIGRARQVPRPFRRLTVRQNLEVAANTAIHGRRTRNVGTRGSFSNMPMTFCTISTAYSNPNRRRPNTSPKASAASEALMLEKINRPSRRSKPKFTNEKISEKIRIDPPRIAPGNRERGVISGR